MLKLPEGFDWLPTGISASAVVDYLNMAGWFFSGHTETLAVSTTGVYGVGQSIGFTNAQIVGGTDMIAVRPIGTHNSAGGWVSAGLNLSRVQDHLPFLGVYDSINNELLCYATFEPNGVVKTYRGPNIPFFGGVLLANSEAGQFNDQTDIDVEVHFKVNTTSGDIEVRINGISVVHAINVNTQPGSLAYFDSICWGWACINNNPVTPSFRIDNLRHYDTTGSLNNTWLGKARVQTLFAAGDGSTIDFTRSNTGLANWQNWVNKNVDDTLYLFDSTATDFNLSTVTPLVNSPTVFGVGLLGFYRQDDATQRTVTNRLLSSGSTFNGAAFNTSNTYTGDLDILETDPATGIQFTGAGLSAVQIGATLTV